MNRPRCVVRSSLNPISSCRETRKKKPFPARHSGKTKCPSYPTPDLPARHKGRGSKKRRWMVGYSDSILRPDVHLLGIPQPGAFNATCPRLVVHTSWRLLQGSWHPCSRTPSFVQSTRTQRLCSPTQILDAFRVPCTN